MRSALAFSLLLVACGADGPGEGAAPDNRIFCRIGPSEAFQRVCRIEYGEDGLFIVRKPDGGLRRLQRVDDQREIIPADGAEPAIVTVADGARIVTIGGDSYRLPATMQP